MQSRKSSMFFVLLVGLLWGLNWPAVKFMLTELPPVTMRALAFPCAALLLAVIVKAFGQRLLPPRREWAPMLVASLFLIFGFNILSTLAQVYTDASKAAIIAYTMPAITAVLAAGVRVRAARGTICAQPAGAADTGLSHTRPDGRLLPALDRAARPA